MSNVNKPATLETGLVIQVPPFVNEGELIRVDTNEGKYLERVKPDDSECPGRCSEPIAFRRSESIC